MKKKKILLVTVLPIWSMTKNSGGKALFSTITYLENKDYDVYLMTDKENDYSKIKIPKEHIFYINTSFFQKKISIRKIGLIFKYLYILYLKNKSIKIFSKINHENMIIYGYEVHGVVIASKIAKKYNLPLITRFQGTIMAKYDYNLKNKIRFFPHFQALTTKSDLVIMTNDGTQGDRVLQKCGNNSKILFIRNGVNILDFNIKSKEEHEYNINHINLLTVSRLENWKRVDRSILALAKLDTKYHLTIIGEGSEEENLKKLVKKYNLADRVTFLGAVANNEVYKYMQAADIFLSFYDLSNVGNPLLEALCLGKMIITYDVGDTNKIIDNKNGILLTDVSPQNIAETISKLTNKKMLEYSRNAKKYAEKNLYSWDTRMQIEYNEIERIYKKYYD